jgi:UrcA family protein
MSAINLTKLSSLPTRLRASVLIGCALGIGSSMAHAATPTDDVASVAVQYSTADLSSDEGARNLYRRIATAAQAVCPNADPRDLDAFALSKSCQSEAIARAVRDVRSPRLAAVSGTRTNNG